MSNSPSTQAAVESFEDRWCCAACYQKNFTLPHARATAEQTANKRVVEELNRVLDNLHDSTLEPKLRERIAQLQPTV